MDDHTVPRMHGARMHRIRIVLAVMLTSALVVVASQAGSGRDLSQQRESASASEPRYSITVTIGAPVVTTTDATSPCAKCR